MKHRSFLDKCIDTVIGSYRYSKAVLDCETTFNKAFAAYPILDKPITEKFLSHLSRFLSEYKRLVSIIKNYSFCLESEEAQNQRTYFRDQLNTMRAKVELEGVV